MRRKTSNSSPVKEAERTMSFNDGLLKEKRLQLYILLAIAFGLYFNSLFNRFAFDDSTYILENSYVQQGIKGIGKILTSDALESYIKLKGGTNSELSGGRYRPLSLVTFAIEKSLFGGSPFISHLINVLLYLFTVAILFNLLSKIFSALKAGASTAFLSVLVFTIHPLHTEVVANIKSRDEILSLLFILLSLKYFFEYAALTPLVDHNKLRQGVKPLWNQKLFAWLFFFLALLSKEYGLFLVFFIPIVAYVYLKKSAMQALKEALPFFVISVLYIFIRLSVTGKLHTAETAAVVNNPYLLASVGEKWATKIYVLFYYVKLLLLPYPLSCDYSYHTIPYRTFSDPLVIVSCLFYLGLTITAFYLLNKKHVLSIALFLFLLPLFLVSNFIIDIGATMGERLVYHSSVGFAIIAGYGITRLLNKLSDSEKTSKYINIVITAILTIAAAFIIIPRNAQWKDSITLFTHDVEVVPNSLLMNHNAALKLMEEAVEKKDTVEKEKLLHTSILYLKRALSVYPKWEYLPVSLGVVYYKMGDLDSASLVWKKALVDFPGLEVAKSNLAALGKDFFDQAVNSGKQGDWDKALEKLQKAIGADSSNTSYWYNLGGIYYTRKDYANARRAWEKTLSIDPNFNEAKGGLATIRGL